MNQHIQNKIHDLKKAAAVSHSPSSSASRSTGNQDSLGQVIRTKNDADRFMSEINVISKRSK
ncbi:hypothetical protein SRABI27_03770 [Pedobacter sp. Bi27]|nr:hypothetical protein SRABI27_03770 [Pedobacter sp. Bi27]